LNPSSSKDHDPAERNCHDQSETLPQSWPRVAPADRWPRARAARRLTGLGGGRPGALRGLQSERAPSPSTEAFSQARSYQRDRRHSISFCETGEPTTARKGVDEKAPGVEAGAEVERNARASTPAPSLRGASAGRNRPRKAPASAGASPEVHHENERRPEAARAQSTRRRRRRRAREDRQRSTGLCVHGAR
jgi:hypothetical protein